MGRQRQVRCGEDAGRLVDQCGQQPGGRPATLQAGIAGLRADRRRQ